MMEWLFDVRNVKITPCSILIGGISHTLTILLVVWLCIRVGQLEAKLKNQTSDDKI